MQREGERGAILVILLWLLGVPAVLLLIALLLGILKL